MNEVANIEQAGKRPYLAPGWYRDLSSEDYHKSFGYGSTTLKMLHEMPYSKMEYRRRHPPEPSAAMQLGSAVHVLALEPHKAEQEIAVMPLLNLRTNAGKAAKAEFLAANAGKLILTDQQYAQAEAMATSLREHPQVGLYLEQGVAEQSIYYWYNPEDWDDERDYRIMCKVRPDWIIPGHHVVFDLKTTKNAAYSEFMRNARKLGYHMSGAMYLDGANRCKEFKKFAGVARFEQFVWICVENEPPYEVASYELSGQDYEEGLQLYHTAVRRLWEYQKSTWKGYGEFDGNEIQPITRLSDMPRWGHNIV